MLLSLMIMINYLSFSETRINFKESPPDMRPCVRNQLRNSNKHKRSAAVPFLSSACAAVWCQQAQIA
jgi:hypothetical protein